MPKGIGYNIKKAKKRTKELISKKNFEIETRKGKPSPANVKGVAEALKDRMQKEKQKRISKKILKTALKRGIKRMKKK